MPGSTAAVALLWSTEPTDRALAGWRPPVWLALGDRGVYRKEWAPLARWAPCKWTMAWYDQTTPKIN